LYLFQYIFIYKLGITSVGSLSLVGVDVPALMQYIGNVPLLGLIAKFSVAFPFVYHFTCGLRHFNWDNNPDKLNTEYVTDSSYKLFVATGVASSIIALL